MRHYWSLEDVSYENVWLTIGSFDGVHRGHQAIIQKLVAGASQAGVPAVVLTFHPHPALILRDRHIPYYLTTPEERLALLDGYGVDVGIIHPFSKDVAESPADTFLLNLYQHLKFKHLLVGHDFALGKDRQGNAQFLSQLGVKMGFTLDIFQPVMEGNRVISSSNIRQALREGEITKANSMLGRQFSLSGQVIHGDGRGRTIGIPTANLAIPLERLTPKAGVYACKARVAGSDYLAVTNIGHRPTFFDQEDSVHIETHILDFSGDIYQQQIVVFFYERLRGEKRFHGVNALIDQIQLDIQVTKNLLRDKGYETIFRPPTDHS